MSAFADLLVRLIGILFGYICAALSAAIFLQLVAWPTLGFGDMMDPWITGVGIVFAAPVSALFVAYYAFLPSMLLIGATEIMRWRGWSTQALLGAVAALAGSGLTLQMTLIIDGVTEHLYAVDNIAMLAATGMISGLVYWAVAGRRAGLWLDRRSELRNRRLPPQA